MRIFLPPIEVGDNEGFTREKDIFGRASLGQSMTALVTNVSDPLVLALDGQWGAGKTTFLKMWAGELRNAGFPVAYLDAFQIDYEEDAFTAVAGEIIALAESLRKGKVVKAFVDKAVGAGKVILRSGLKLGVKAATLGVLSGADLEGVASDWAKEASEIEDKYLGELLTKQKEQQKAIQAFRESLAALPALLSKNASDDASSRPLVVIIDELDRCRPIFALKLLERIKHFFAVPNVHFVLGAHLGQLRNSVKVAYGSDIDAHLYLQKFVQFTIHLVDREDQMEAWASTKYLKYMIEKLEFKKEDYDLIDEARKLILHVARSRDLSLRTIERVMTTFALSLASRGQQSAPGYILGGLCLLKNTRPDLFVKAKMGFLAFDEIIDELAFGVPANDYLTHAVETARLEWMYFTGTSLPVDTVQRQFIDLQRWFGASSPKLLAFAANNIVDKLQFDSSF